MKNHMLKYSVRVGEEAIVPLPQHAPILHVACQSSAESVEFWTLVDLEQDQSDDDPRKFTILGTGMEVPQNHIYCGTGLSPDGRLVWHLFEIAEESHGIDD